MNLTATLGTHRHLDLQPSYCPPDTNCDGGLANHPVTQQQSGNNEVNILRSRLVNCVDPTSMLLLCHTVVITGHIHFSTGHLTTGATIARFKYTMMYQSDTTQLYYVYYCIRATCFNSYRIIFRPF